LAGAELLGRLRVTGRARPAADPAFTADLRSFLEDGLAGSVVPATSSGPGRLLVTRDRLTRALACPVHRSAEPSVEQVDAHPGDPAGPRRAFSTPLACGALVGALFRQIVAVGDVGDPMDDSLEALSLDDRQAPLVAWIRGMAEADRSELRAEVDRQARGLLERWPSLDPSWMPRTQEVLRAALVGGAVELRTRVDLAVGRPSGSEASVALLEVVSGARRPEHRDDRRFAALVAALRGPVPPFAVATYYSRTGELEVDPVDHEYLVAGARRCLSAARVLLGTDQAPSDDADCAACRPLLRRPPVVVPVVAADRDGGSAAAGSAVGAEPVARVRPAGPGGPGGPVTFPREVAA
jgi:hypothetical protein